MVRIFNKTIARNIHLELIKLSKNLKNNIFLNYYFLPSQITNIEIKEHKYQKIWSFFRAALVEAYYRIIFLLRLSAGRIFWRAFDFRVPDSSFKIRDWSNEASLGFSFDGEFPNRMSKRQYIRNYAKKNKRNIKFYFWPLIISVVFKKLNFCVAQTESFHLILLLKRSNNAESIRKYIMWLQFDPNP